MKKEKNLHIQTSFMLIEHIGKSITTYYPIMSSGTFLYVPYQINKNIRIIL